MLRIGFSPCLKPWGVTLIYTSNSDQNMFFFWWISCRNWTGTIHLALFCQGWSCQFKKEARDTFLPPLTLHPSPAQRPADSGRACIYWGYNFIGSPCFSFLLSIQGPVWSRSGHSAPLGSGPSETSHTPRISLGSDCLTVCLQITQVKQSSLCGQIFVL